MKGVLKRSKFNLFLTVCLSFVILILSGCSDDPEPATIAGCTDQSAENFNPDATEDDGSCIFIIPGCTDEEAENYNAEATEENGSCVYASEKFIGVYDGSSDCMGALIIPTLSNNNLVFEIKAKIGGGVNDVLLSLPIQGVPVSYDATVSGDVLTVDALLANLPFPNPLNPLEFILIDIKADGQLTYTSSTSSVNGTIAIKMTTTVTGSTIDKGSCEISGVKQ